MATTRRADSRFTTQHAWIVGQQSVLSLIAEVVNLGQLIVRNIDDQLVRALKRRAANHGRSAEAEHREILREVLESDEHRPSFDEFLASMPDVGTDEDFNPPRGMPRDVDLDA